MKFSDFLKLNVVDFIKGFVVSLITAALVVIQATISSGVFTFDWTLIWHSSLTAGIAYLVKNFFTNSTGNLGTESTN